MPAALALLAGLAGGCSPEDGPGPPALSATLSQSRMGVAEREVLVTLANAGTEDVVVERMTLVSAAFVSPMPYPKQGSVLGAGRRVAMPVVLGGAVCDGVPARHTVHVDYRLPDGARGTARVPADDGHEQVARVHVAECFAQEVASMVTLSLRDDLGEVQRGDHLVARLDLDVEVHDRAASGRVRILGVSGSTLLQHVDPGTGDHLAQGRVVDLAVPDGGAATVPLHLVPSRCDAHAVAEDKQGTRLRVAVELDGVPGPVVVAASDGLRAALHAYVHRACAPSPDPRDP